MAKKTTKATEPEAAEAPPEQPRGIAVPETATRMSTDVEVLIHGTVIQDVHSYDEAAGLVWCHDGDDPKAAVQLKTGTVTVRPHPLKGKAG